MTSVCKRRREGGREGERERERGEFKSKFGSTMSSKSRWWYEDQLGLAKIYVIVWLL